jgi:hypothetical protein
MCSRSVIAPSADICARPTLSIASHGIGTLSSLAAALRSAAHNATTSPAIDGIARRKGLIRTINYIDIEALKPTHD